MKGIHKKQVNINKEKNKINRTMILITDNYYTFTNNKTKDKQFYPGVIDSYRPAKGAQQSSVLLFSTKTISTKCMVTAQDTGFSEVIVAYWT